MAATRSPQSVPRGLAFALLSSVATAAAAYDVDDPEVRRAVERGRAAQIGYLRGQSAGTAERSLAALAVVKAGLPPEESVVTAALEAVTARVAGGRYRPGQHHIYAAGVELMLLEAVGRPEDDPAREAIRDYILRTQRDHGGWYYPDRKARGDTSITQYAALGLWAAERSGLDVPASAWDRLAGWQATTVVKDGGFTYHPPAGSSRATMTLAGIGTLSLCGRYLGVVDRAVERPAPSRGRKRFGFLEAVEADAPRPGEDAPEVEIEKRRTSAGTIRKAAAGARAWVEERPRFPTSESWPFYELYALERAVALSGPDRWRGLDWYDQGVTWLLDRQGPGGGWNSRRAATGAGVATSFALLFLTKSTHKTLGVRERPATPDVGDGLLAGGRGLPGDLAAVRVRGGRVESRDVTAPLDRLLADLEAPPEAAEGPTDVVALRDGLIAAVRGGRRSELSRRFEDVVALARHRDPRVRRAAAWAAGRVEDDDAPVLLVRLLRGDPDGAVATEANAALLFFARRPPDVDVPGPPVDGSGDDFAIWRSHAVDEWSAWLRSVRPDLFDGGLDPLTDPLFDPTRK